MIVRMAEHKWVAPRHQDVPAYAAASLPLDQIGESEELDAREPVWIDRLTFDQIGELEKVKAFGVARSDVAVYVKISWQGRRQRAWVPRSSVTRRKLTPRHD